MVLLLSRSLEKVTGYYGSSAASSITNLVLSGPGLMSCVPLLLHWFDHLLLQALHLIDAPSSDCPLLHVVITIRPPLVL
jgi:hypothetical protein